ncbi:MAG: UvrD-helicase domain-containing protein, partial [Vulcanimicrobiaceae bacterium]
MSAHVVCGPAGSGKSAQLRQRVSELVDANGTDAVHMLCPPFDELACAMLARLDIPESTYEIIDDAHAFEVLTFAAQPLFDLQWEEFSQGLDPEVSGLRSPDRFLMQAYSLFGKLQGALIEPPAFLDACLRGATAFYGSPHNLAHPKLLLDTPEKYRSSLAVDENELTRQYKHEVALARILAKLYEEYLAELEAQAQVTPSGALLALVQHLRANPSDASKSLGPIRALAVDDVHNCTLAEITLLRLLADEPTFTLIVAGDGDSAIARFRGARPDLALAVSKDLTTLAKRYRRPASLQAARAATQEAEADIVARWVEQQASTGMPLHEIAIVLRSMERAELYERALLARNIPSQSLGACNPFAHRDALDALAPLFFAVRPEHSDWLLRLLTSPALALSDASLATLCGVPQAQIELLASPNTPAARDPLRLERLMRNVIGGNRDGELSSLAAERLARLRELRNSWLTTTSRVDALVTTIWRDALASAQSSAARQTQQIVLKTLFSHVMG